MTKPRKKTRPQAHAKLSSTAFDRAWREMRNPAAPPPSVSGRWLLTALSIALAGASLCCWGTLCLLFWQGSWQLLYHPAAEVARTPASLGMAFDPVAFAATETGQTRLTGWWIPAAPEARFGRFTILFLHGQSGNLGNSVDGLMPIHEVGVNVLAFDYRGYGQSQFARPSEAHWREDAELALKYLTGTRQIAPRTIVVDGEGLGANLALEVAAAHPDLAGVILRDPIPEPANAIFNDARGKLVPARLLVRDRYDLDRPAVALRIPSLWLLRIASPPNPGMVEESSAFKKVSAHKMQVWLPAQTSAPKEESDSLSRWLGDLPALTR